KWSCRCSTRLILQDGRFDFKKPFRRKKFPYHSYDIGSHPESFDRFIVCNHLSVSLPVEYFSIFYSMPFFRHWTERFVEKLEFFNEDRNLTCVALEDDSFDTYYVSYGDMLFEKFIILRSIFSYVRLYSTKSIFDVKK